MIAVGVRMHMMKLTWVLKTVKTVLVTLRTRRDMQIINFYC